MSGFSKTSEAPDGFAASIDTIRVILRAAEADDLPFLYNVYASTRAAELAMTGWDIEQQRTFLTTQFEAQHRHYRTHFPDAAYHVIEINGRSAGRLYVHRRGDELRIIDIALLAEYRGRGLGTQLLKELLDEARIGGKRVLIHVERYNPALNLYSRLGFESLSDDGVYLQMMWSAPEGRAQPKTAS